MKQINDFARKFGISLSLNDNLIIEKHNRYFLLQEGLKQLLAEDFFYAGAYLGKIKKGIFFPSFILLAKMAKVENSNKIIVNEKTEWLFIVGRDVFKQGIIEIFGPMRKGEFTLILNQHRECLGFGKILHNIEQEKDKHKVIVKNISDIGDFLRRERNSMQ